MKGCSSGSCVMMGFSISGGEPNLTMIIGGEKGRSVKLKVLL